MVPESYYVALSAILFCMGVLGVLIRRDPLVIFMSIEVMLNAANLALVAFGQRHGTTEGQALVFFAIIVAIFRQRRRLSVDELSSLRG
jgi:NADH-quinone oxidoreductase subunit K